VRSPITFGDWLRIVGILFLIGICFLILKQLPFISDFLDKISDYIEIQDEYIY
jgi:hypothetical protein